MKRVIGLIVGFGIVIASLLVGNQTAEAASLSILGVRSSTATCLTAYDHIDQNGRPYGTRQTRCAGESFSHSIDWDMVCWPPGYQLRLMLTSGNIIHDNTSDNCRKVTTGGTYLVWTVRD